MSNAGTNTLIGMGTLDRPEAPPVASFAEAKIDRVVAKVDPAASKRVLRRLRGGRRRTSFA